jgi:wyosine [tRNA(Phe)-imidazoG37] synthetase (radical SAM superfamily)
LQYRSWSRVTSGVLLSVIGAVQYGTSKVFYPTLSSPTREKFDIVDRPHPQTSEGF